MKRVVVVLAWVIGVALCAWLLGAIVVEVP